MRYITPPRMLATVVCVAGFAMPALLGATPSAQASSTTTSTTYGPGSPFYTYTGSTPLTDISPGTVLASRTFVDKGFLRPVTVVQLLYRSTGTLGQATTNVTSVLMPHGTQVATEAISDDTAYDSLNPMDEPSVRLDEGHSFDSGNVTPFLADGIAVIMPDTEGQEADLAEGRVYGMNTLDSVKAATSSSLTGLSSATRVVLMGYSGGAWATEWAAQLAPSYAPGVNLIGAAEGGVPVDGEHIAEYVSGSDMFTGEIPMAIIGLGRAFDFDFKPYLSAEGLKLYNKLQNADLGSTIEKYPGLTVADLLLPQYADPDSIPGYVPIINQENLGLVSPATIPLFIVQGANGDIEGAKPNATLGDGDGATVTGDVRTLALQACAAGTPVDYNQYNSDDHLTAAAVWAGDFGASLGAHYWITNLFAGKAAPNDCSTIAPGNSLAAEQVVPAG